VPKGLLAGLVAATLALAALPSEAAAKNVRVALLPIVVNSNSGETGYLSRGLAEMISARLEQSGQIAIVRLTEGGAGATDRAAAVVAGAKAGAEFVVFGSYTQFGDGASLDLRCAAVAGSSEDDPRRVFIQAGSPGEIIPQLSEMSDRMTEYLVGAAASAPPSVRSGEAGATAGDEFAKLRTRIEFLERAVSDLEAAKAPAKAATAPAAPPPEEAVAEAAPTE